MKRYIFIIMTAAFAGLASCSGFLDETDQDKFIPSTADHYAALMLQEFNSRPGGLYSTVQFMSDEVIETDYTIRGSAERDGRKPVFTWQKNIEILENGTTANNNYAWERLYRQIAVVNYVIAQIDAAEGSQQERDFVKGEAFFIRAYCYFCLTNLYAAPYENPQQSREAYGVPLRTGIGVEQTYEKQMLDECYSLILSDLDEARTLIEQSGLTRLPYHPTVKACDLLLSRVQLYMKDYQGVIVSASNAIAGSWLSPLTLGSENTAVITVDNPEVFYSFSEGAAGHTDASLSPIGMVVNGELLDSYHISDMRRNAYFIYRPNTANPEEVSVYPRKNTNAFTTIGRANLRLAGAYLNRAEAYALTGQYDKAREDMRELLSKRYLNRNDIAIPGNDPELLAFIFRERLKELCFEEHHRWFDLRRMDPEMRPEITHRFTTVNANGEVSNVEYYKLLSYDPNYTLSVPMGEKANNPFIRDYERFDKLPE